MVVFLFSLLFLLSSVYGTSTDEREGLTSLYNATDGENWVNNTNWLTGDPCGNFWHGVSCLSHDEYVYELLLAGNGLNGTIPPLLGEVHSLEILNLQFNLHLSGEVPFEVLQLPRLKILDLGQCSLTGDILSNFSNPITNQIFLNENRFTGTISTEIGSLTSLFILYLSENSFTGTLPTEIGKCPHLSNIFLDYNSFVGSIPTEIGILRELIDLFGELGENSFTGTIPTEIGELSECFKMDMRDNNLIGSIPSQIGRLSNLNYLGLGDNSINGTLPTEVGQMSQLTQLILDGNSITGSIPTEIGQLSFLEALILSSNSLKGEIPTEIEQLESISRIELDNNLLTGSFPPIAENLYILSLALNSLKGSIPISVPHPLVFLNVSSNMFSGSIENSTWLCDTITLDMSNNLINCPLLSCCSDEGNGGCVMTPEEPCYSSPSPNFNPTRQ